MSILTKSSAVKGSPLLLNPTTMLAIRLFISSTSVDSAKIAITSDPTEMQNEVCLVLPFSVGLSPMVIFRKNRSFMSTTVAKTRCDSFPQDTHFLSNRHVVPRGHVMFAGSISSRANLRRSSSVNAFGSVFAMLSFCNRLS